MRPDDERLKEYRTKAQIALDDACVKILDGQASATTWLVKAHRVGMTKAAATQAFEALRQCINDAEETYTAAIAQPEAKISGKSRINLAEL